MNIEPNTRDMISESIPSYPPRDVERAASAVLRCEGTSGGALGDRSAAGRPFARIEFVEEESPFDDAGFEPGCCITTVDGAPVRDVIDWRWLSAEDEIEVGYIDLDGEAGSVALVRDEGEDWGVTFDGVVFDGVRTCRNACTFCFMRQLPQGLRRSLYVRDDDFRLSFLSGTFVTFTNLALEDEERILEQRISPLRFSLQAVSPAVRTRLIGPHAEHGLAAADRLLAAGIEMHAQIVLVPGENDGEELVRTLSWAAARKGVLSVGIVPLGFTDHQDVFDRSFDDSPAACAVLDAIRPFQEKALAERGSVWVYAADEFYRNAYGECLLDQLPDAAFYGDFGMFEDGIGIIRSAVDEWRAACREGLDASAARALASQGARARLIVGEAMEPYFSQLLKESACADRIVPLVVKNRFFGGNVNVTGLLAGVDIADAIRDVLETAPCGESNRDLFFLPTVVLNDDGLTLDGMTVEDVGKRGGRAVRVVSCSPYVYLQEIIDSLA